MGIAIITVRFRNVQRAGINARHLEKGGMDTDAPESTPITLICTRDTFQPAPVEWVRWLALNADLYRVQQAFRTSGRTAPAYADWEEWHRQGYRFSAAMVQNVIVSSAAVLKHSETVWELAAVRTQEAHLRKGYGKAACTFITRYILDNLSQAVCHVAADNDPMLNLVKSLGYTESSRS
jgi:RimJ/RimL family protein N-acetyltransferase